MRLGLIVLAIFISIIVKADYISDNKSEMRLPFKDGERISLVLSNRDINRLAVLDDLITDVRAKEGYFSTLNDKLGGIYLKINVSDPFTIFILTQHDHYLSILVNPKPVDGKSYLLIPKCSENVASNWEQSSDYQNTLINLIRAMILNDPLEGFKIIEDKREAKNLDLIEIYRGSKISGLVYIINNRSLRLSERDLYKPNILAVAISDNRVYKIISNE